MVMAVVSDTEEVVVEGGCDGEGGGVGTCEFLPAFGRLTKQNENPTTFIIIHSKRSPIPSSFFFKFANILYELELQLTMNNVFSS